MSTSPYEILGVAETATQDEIKRAHRRLARRYHPDRDGGDDAAFKEVQDAYDLLSDTTRRNAFDASRAKPKPKPGKRSTAARVSKTTHAGRGTVVDVNLDVVEAVEDVVGGLISGLSKLGGRKRPRGS